MSNTKYPTDDAQLNNLLRGVASKAMNYALAQVRNGAALDKENLRPHVLKFLDWYFLHEDVTDPRQFEKELLTFDTYARAASETESVDVTAILARMTKTDLEHIRDKFKSTARDKDIEAKEATPLLRIFHAVLGMASEAGEAVDAVKKHLFYGAELDKNNLVEEAGDMLWYLAILSLALEVPLAEIAQRNINKLRKRYKGAEFTQDEALNRNLDEEQKAVDGEGLDDCTHVTMPECPMCHDSNGVALTEDGKTYVCNQHPLAFYFHFGE